MYALLCADVKALDAANAPFAERDAPTARDALDGWLVEPMDPRQAQAEQNVLRHLPDESEG